MHVKKCDKCDGFGKCFKIETKQCTKCCGTGYNNTFHPYSIESSLWNQSFCEQCEGKRMIQHYLDIICDRCGGSGGIGYQMVDCQTVNYRIIICNRCGGNRYIRM